MPTVTNHGPVTVALIASAAVAVFLAILKAKFGIEFSGQEANLQVLATALGYMVVGQKVTT